MRGYYVPRKAGWDCHGLPVELEVEKELGISSKAEIEAYGIAEFNAALPRVGLPLRRGLEPPDGADRLLGRPRRRLRHARQRVHRVRLVGAAADLGRRIGCTRATRSSRTARAAGPRSPRTRSRRATTTSRTRRSTSGFPVTEPAGPLEPGDTLLVWTTTPWTLVSNAAVAVGPEIEYVRARVGRRDRRRGRRAGRARARRGRRGARRRSRAPRSPAPATSRRSTTSPARLRPARAHGAARRLRHDRGRHRPRAHRDRLRRGRLPPRRAVRADAAEPGRCPTAPTTSAIADFAGQAS